MKIVQLLWVLVIFIVQVKVNDLLFFVFWTWITQVMKPQQNSSKENFYPWKNIIKNLWKQHTHLSYLSEIHQTSHDWWYCTVDTVRAGGRWLWQEGYDYLCYQFILFYNIYIYIYIIVGIVQTCVAIDSLKTIHRQTVLKRTAAEQSRRWVCVLYLQVNTLVGR